MYQHEIALVSQKDSNNFPLMAVTNLDQVKTLHLHKGEVVGFARTESTEVTYIATTNELNIEEEVDVIPRNWIPKRKWERKTGALKCAQATTSDCSESSQNSRKKPSVSILRALERNQTHEKTADTEKTREFLEHSQDSRQPSCVRKNDCQQNSVYSTENSESLEHSRNSRNQEWCDIAEVVDSDFLISPGDIYPNRKVELEDAEIKDSTRDKFELLCEAAK